ncbi:hypothetical protein D9615_001078 [Tricholomella constricta]|uniref:VASt domain-containing protein n=1 Tax=Tricholomella constricta TaxID=117010 RepID=A0A8H5M982_9AGAR|nr:hypothetical protein D9615_001078 [Tricholomella constricta]
MFHYTRVDSGNDTADIDQKKHRGFSFRGGRNYSECPVSGPELSSDAEFAKLRWDQEAAQVIKGKHPSLHKTGHIDTPMAAPTTEGHATNAYKLPSFSVDEARPMKVVAIGAGYSGITAGVRFRQRVKNVDITVYESNAGVGGTWFANRYPGLACDIPSHATDWSAFYAPGPEIRAYLNHVVDKYKLRPFIKLRHRITGAVYNAQTGKWHLKVRRPRAGSETEKGEHVVWDWTTDFEEFDDTADVVLAGMGPLSRWSWPDIEGLESFNGRVMHSAQWDMGEDGKGTWQDTVKDWGDKRVGIIGVGSSAIQMVPALQSRTRHVTNYVRGKTWLSAPFVRERLDKLANGEPVSNYIFTEEDKKKFQDPAYYNDFRWQLESELNSANPATLRGSAMQEGAKIAFREDMVQKLAKKPWIADHCKHSRLASMQGRRTDRSVVIPDFAPCCRRLTPGPGYLEALCADNVDFVPTHISKVTPTGIETVDGKHQDLDIIICATGFDTSFQFDFPILGRKGADLSKKFEPHPRTYLAVAVDGFPNWFSCLGPNAAVGAGSLLLVCERQVDYAVAATLKLQRERLKSIEVKAQAVDDFDAYLESYFPSTVYSEKCRSWYKAGKEQGRVMALWPGSALHAARALANPRWEDYEYEGLDDSVKNRFYWLGDGQTVDDKDSNGDKAWYLKEVDYPPDATICEVYDENGAGRVTEVQKQYKFACKQEMAPNFFTKLVNKAATPTHSRDRSDRSVESPRSSTSKPRSRAPSSAAPMPPPPPPRSPSPNPKVQQPTKVEEKPRIPTFITTNVDGGEESGADSDSTFPSVTIVPPSPFLGHRDLSRSNSDTSLASSANHRPDGPPSNNNNSRPISTGRTTSHSAATTTADGEPELSTPTTPRPRTPSNASRPRTKSRSRPVTPVSSAEPNQPQMLESAAEIRKQSSNRSLKRPPPVNVNHARAATAPPPQGRDSNESQDGQTAVYTSMTPIVESPKAMQMLDYTSPTKPSSTPQQTSPSASSTYLTSPARDADSASIISNNNKDKKRPWRRSTASRKPTGLANAIAASSLAMANHSLTAAQQAQFSAAATAQQQPPNSASTVRKLSTSGSPPYSTPSASTSSRHLKNKSAEMSPRSAKSIRLARSPRRGGSLSIHSDNASEYYGEDRPDYYSGLEDSSDDGGSSSEDDLEDLDLGEDDIPVTGFAVASNKRNADFHELFPNIPEGDYLIDDYGCALQREILIQGRLYISENHICFHANIFGWITDLSIPINEVKHLEKKMTAFVIPNGIQVTTRQAKYTFASFLSRDTTYDVIYNIWKLERPDDASIISSVGGRTSFDAPSLGMEQPAAGEVAKSMLPVKKATMCACGREGKHLAETALETVLPGTPERIHNLIFASGFMKDFMAVNQKLMDIQISDWTPTAPGSTLLARNMSYIKPLNGSLGPKQTKCELRDETVYRDFDDYVVTMTTTRTPDVPSGGVFAVKTRTCIMWASAVSTRIVVTTEVEWTGRSFIKGIIERSAIDGQKVYHGDLEKAMRGYIKEHQSEFVPEGVDPAALSQAVSVAKAIEPSEGVAEKAPGLSEEEERKKREHERNQRGLQWAWDTFEGASQVARRSTRGAIELVGDAWEQSTATAILWFIIVILVFSNLWTLMRVGKREEASLRKSLRKEEEREKWVQGVVTALWDELGAAKANQVPQASYGALPPVAASWREEVTQLLKTLDSVDDRIQTLRSSLNSVERLDKMD